MTTRNACLLIMALTPAIGACANATSAPVMLARVDAAVPPMPPELAGAPNGKADPPFQVGAELVLAAQVQRQAAAVRTARVEPGAMDRGSPKPATNARVAFAQVAAPTVHAQLDRSAATTLASNRLGMNKVVDVGPVAAISYADLVRADAAAAPTPLATASSVAAAPRRSDVRARRLIRVSHVAGVPAARPALVKIAVHSPAPRRSEIVALHGRRIAHPAIPAATMMVRLRTIVAGWLNTIRI